MLGVYEQSGSSLLKYMWDVMSTGPQVEPATWGPSAHCQRKCSDDKMRSINPLPKTQLLNQDKTQNNQVSTLDVNEAIHTQKRFFVKSRELQVKTSTAQAPALLLWDVPVLSPSAPSAQRFDRLHCHRQLTSLGTGHTQLRRRSHYKRTQRPKVLRTWG